ncbi:MAG: lysylphosphatidylglycerol synthase domain-containing protein [Flavobacteriales bacterium]|nr:lysylphosphatidylglycerol synthase domain-containing protein [Flavobacteriales bacterium]
MPLRIAKKNLGTIIKVVVALLAVWFIARELKLKEASTDLLDDAFFLLQRTRYDEMAMLMLAMLTNWMLEAYKWRVLISSIEDISLWKSLKAVFSGVTIAFFTPNRVGEYGGRVFHLDRADRIDAVLLTVVGSYAQLTVTIVAGLLAMTFYLPAHEGTGPLSSWQYGFVSLGMFALCGFLVLLFLNTRLLTVVLQKLQLPQSVLSHVKVLEAHSPQSLVRVLAASAGRYAIFTAQFYVLLRVFSVDVGYADAMMMIAMTYFVMTGIPTIAITEVVTRGSVAVYFLSQVSDNTAGIVSASSVLWLINLVIPALFGVVTIFGLKFFRK